MNPDTELNQDIKLFDAMPKQSYKDFVLWLCLNFIDNVTHTAQVVGHPLFLSIAEYEDWVASYAECETVIETLVKPLNGASADSVVC